jgi:hypothetical protein
VNVIVQQYQYGQQCERAREIVLEYFFSFVFGSQYAVGTGRLVGKYLSHDINKGVLQFAVPSPNDYGIRIVEYRYVWYSCQGHNATNY